MTQYVRSIHWYAMRPAKVALLVFMLVLTGGLAFGPHTVSAAESEHAGLMPLKVQYYPGFFFTQSTFVAYYSGIFKKHGLDVTLVPISNGPAVGAAVHSGAADVGALDLDQIMINTHVVGLNFVAICGSSGSFYHVVIAPGFSMSGPTTYPAMMANFVGKRLGVTALGADTHYYWKALFKAAGLSTDSGHYISIGAGQEALSAVEHNLVDATIGFEPLTTIEVQHGAKVVLDFAKGEGPLEIQNIVSQNQYFVSKSFLAANPKAVTAFKEAILEAVKFQQDPKNFEAVVSDMKQAMGPLGSVKGFDKIIHDGIKPSSVTAITLNDVKAWLAFSQAFLDFPRDVTPEGIMKEVLWSNACN